MYLQFHNNPSLEFEFLLAEKLHMTVGEMRVRMSQNEFQHWSIYLARKAQRQQLENG